MGLGVCAECDCHRFDRKLTTWERSILVSSLHYSGKEDYRRRFAAEPPHISAECVCRHRFDQHDGLYGAIATVLSDGELSYGWSFRAETQAKAEVIALEQTHAPELAVVRISGSDTCLAIAASKDNESLGWGSGPTLDMAGKEALRFCEGRKAAVAVSVDVRTGELRGKLIR
jgi:hypothetical protein